MSNESSNPIIILNDNDNLPREAAHPDNQGPFSTCTRHSLSKASVDGYEDGIFAPGKKDFSIGIRESFQFIRWYGRMHGFN